jgi:hypothetical protein
MGRSGVAAHGDDYVRANPRARLARCQHLSEGRPLRLGGVELVERLHGCPGLSVLAPPERAAYLGSGAFLGWSPCGSKRARSRPLHYPLVLAALVVAVFSNANAIRRFRGLYATVKTRADTGL